MKDSTADSLLPQPAISRKNAFLECLWPILLLALSAYVLRCGLIIEILNARAGYRLPRTDTVNGRLTKWRIAAEGAIERHEQHLREMIGPDAEPLMETSEQKLQRRWERKLRDTVGTYGLLQYFFCPILFFLGIIWMFCSSSSWAVRMFVGSVAVLSSFYSLILAVERQYFQSLGW